MMISNSVRRSQRRRKKTAKAMEFLFAKRKVKNGDRDKEGRGKSQGKAKARLYFMRELSRGKLRWGENLIYAGKRISDRVSYRRYIKEQYKVDVRFRLKSFFFATTEKRSRWSLVKIETALYHEYVRSECT